MKERCLVKDEILTGLGFSFELHLFRCFAKLSSNTVLSEEINSRFKITSFFLSPKCEFYKTSTLSVTFIKL